MGSFRFWLWFGLIAIVVLIGLGAWFLLSALHPAPAPAPGNQQTAGTQGTVPTYAPQGQLVSGFPKELILDSNAQLQGSYAVTYSSSTNQYTAQWISSMTMNDLFLLYKEYFLVKRWTISNEMNSVGARGFHAENGSAAVGVAIIDNQTQRTVNITYVAF